MPTLFFSYSHKDEPFRDQLEVHLSALKRQKAIEAWHDRKITAGTEIDKAIDKWINKAEVILLLISPDFIASDYCYDTEVQRALQRHLEGTARVIPVILRPCDWHGLPFGKLLATPTDGRAITTWRDRDEAFLDVVKSIKAALREIARSQSVPPPDAPSSSSIASPEAGSTNPKAKARDENGHGLSAERASVERLDHKKRDSRSYTRQPRVGIDMGTSFTRLYVEGRGVVLEEASAIAFSKPTYRITKVGDAAIEGIGRTGDWLIRPLDDSIISDPDAAFQMLRHFLDVAGIGSGCHTTFAVPSVATKASLKILFDVAKRLKLGKVDFVYRTLLAGMGEDLSGRNSSAGMTVEMGAGTTDVAIIHNSRLYYSRVVRTGGIQMNDAITAELKRRYNLLIGDRTAELIKLHVGSAAPLTELLHMEVKGRNLIEGTVKSVNISDETVRGAIQDCIEPLIHSIRQALDRMPAEIASKVTEHDVALSGGCALVRGITDLIQSRLHVRVVSRKDPLHCVVSGFGSLFDGGWNVADPVLYPPKPLRPASR